MKVISYHKKILLLNILVFINTFSIPFSFVFNSISIFLLFILSFFFIDKIQLKKSFRNYRNPLVLLIVFYFLQCFGFFYSENKTRAIQHLMTSIPFLVLPITFINLKSSITKRVISFALLGFLFGVLSLLILTHINIAINIIENSLPASSLIKDFTRVNFIKFSLYDIHPPYYAIMVVFCIVIIFYNSFLFFKKNTSKIKFVVILYLTFSLYQISSLMAIGLIFLFFIFNLKTILKALNTILVTILLVCFLFVISFIFYSQKNISVKEFDGGSLINRIDWMFFKGKGDTSRPHNWNSVLKVIIENPILGVGTDGGLEELKKYRDISSESYIDNHNAHNQYLEIFLRFGLFGFVLFSTILVLLFKQSFFLKNKIFLWFLVFFCAASLTESYLQRQIGIVFFCFFVSLFSVLVDNNNIYEESIST